jgi:hypothetical protein
MDDIGVESSEDEEFTASERPEKRRRLNDANSFEQSEEDGSDADEYDLPSNGELRSKTDYDDTESPQAVAAKSKYLMHVPQFEEPQEQIFLTQLTQPHSTTTTTTTTNRSSTDVQGASCNTH